METTCLQAAGCLHLLWLLRGEGVTRADRPLQGLAWPASGTVRRSVVPGRLRSLILVSYRRGQNRHCRATFGMLSHAELSASREAPWMPTTRSNMTWWRGVILTRA
jgi:hypothetical protein